MEMEMHTKWVELSKLKQGAVVLLTNGDEAIFVRLKQKKFIGTINGGTFDIPVQMFVKIVKQAEQVTGYSNLKSGEAFYIKNNKCDALLFIFKEMKGGKIIGINPITKTLTRIDATLYAGKVSDI